MSDIITDYQEEKALNTETKESDGALFATVGTIGNSGMTLIFDGSAESAKAYKANINALFKAGQRVKVAKVRGTYIVEYPVGNPNDKETIATLSTSATLAQTISKFNELILLLSHADILTKT